MPSGRFAHPDPSSSGPAGSSAGHPQRAAPRAVGPYELLLELGRGNMGAVWLGRRPGIDRLFAVKLVRLDGDAAAEERLQREARLSSRLEHPGIVPCLDVGAEPGQGLRWLVMDFVPGRTLEQVLQARGRLEPLEAARLVAEAAEAVAAAHQAGVIHRDLKPANIIIDARTARPRVTDFGLARELGSQQSLTRTGDVLGTPAYMSPEQMLGGRADARSDVWALGAILYELLTGTRPVVGSTVIELAQQLDRGTIEPPSRARPEVPAQLEAVCLRALRRDPDQRPAQAGELARTLREAILALETAPLRAAARPGSSALTLALGGGLAAALLLAVGLAVAGAGRVSRDEHQAALARAGQEAAAARAEASRREDELSAARAELRRAREELAAVERELAHTAELQVGMRDRAGKALGWVERELAGLGLARSTQARILLAGARPEDARRLALAPGDERGPELLDLLALRIRLGLVVRDRALLEGSARELARLAPAGGAQARLATLALSMGRAEEVLADLRRTPPQDPDLLWLMIVLLRGSLRAEDDLKGMGEVLALLDRYLQLVPCDTQMLQFRAVFFWGRWLVAQDPGDLERSLRDLLQARDVAPLPASDWLNPGICLVSLGCPRAATFELEEAVRQTSGPPGERNRARTWLGNAWIRRGDEARAAGHWEEAIRTDRTSALELAEHLELCSPALRERIEKAMEGVPLQKRYRVGR